MFDGYSITKAERIWTFLLELIPVLITVVPLYLKQRQKLILEEPRKEDNCLAATMIPYNEENGLLVLPMRLRNPGNEIRSVIKIDVECTDEHGHPVPLEPFKPLETLPEFVDEEKVWDRGLPINKEVKHCEDVILVYKCDPCHVLNRCTVRVTITDNRSKKSNHTYHVAGWFSNIVQKEPFGLDAL